MNICSSTKFLFILTSATKLEDRFLYDAQLFIKIIQHKGVNLSNVVIATDEQESIVLAKCPLMHGVKFITSSQLISTIKTIDDDNLIILADCHGSIKGIDSKSPIMPYSLTDALKSNSSLKNIVVFFGQCYAGIYNWVDVRKDNTNIVYIGATGFNSSFSYCVGGIKWFANISLVAFGNWLLNPTDIDGDGMFSVMDLYKYIAWFTNKITDDIEKENTSHLIDAKMELKQARDKGDNTLMLQLEKEAIKVMEHYIVPHQNPWLLNSISAQKITFD